MLAMKVYIILFTLTAFVSYQAFAQNATKKNTWTITFDIGPDVSIGSNILKSKAGVRNPNFGVSYYATRRYDHPSLRARISVMKVT